MSWLAEKLKFFSAKPILMETTNHPGIILIDLVKINRDRIELYMQAYKDLKDQHNTLRNVLFEMENQCIDNCKELLGLLLQIFTMQHPFSIIKGKAYRIWAKFKTGYVEKDKISIINSLDFNEEAAERAYTYALNVNVPDEAKAIISKQLGLIRDMHERIKKYNDVNRSNEFVVSNEW